jgi:hypothetical protein
MWTLIATVAGLVLVGCSAAGDPSVAPQAGDVVLSPSPELVDAVTEAAARWSAATGLAIVVADGGVPMRTVPDAIDPSGYRVCALTEVSPANGPVGMAIDIDPPANTGHAVDQVIAHELGHIIARTFDPEMGDAHTPTGLMRPRNGTPEIDAVSLARVCEFAPCSVFAPEPTNAPL